jgi:hypothetical protein
MADFAQSVLAASAGGMKMKKGAGDGALEVESAFLGKL